MELLNLTVPFFEKRGVESPRLNAELLLAHVLGCPRIELYTRFEETLPEEKVSAFRETVRRRGEREPLQHLLGKTEFRDVEVLCDKRAMIPRQETELLVELAAAFLEGRDDPLAAEIGVGTGCVSMALAKAVPGCRIVGTDISLDALELALENVERAALADRVRLLEGDLCAPLVAEGFAARFDVLISNPPYIRADDIAGLQPEVRLHDPRVALDGGRDGLDVYRRLFAEAPPLVKPGGGIVVETPDEDQDEIVRLAETEGWTETKLTKDAAGIDRAMSAVRGPG